MRPGRGIAAEHDGRTERQVGPSQDAEDQREAQGEEGVSGAGAQATEEELIQWCRDNLARYKVPRKVVFGTLPTTATGKIQKYVLRDTAKRL